jgi:hypothetical protein
MEGIFGKCEGNRIINTSLGLYSHKKRTKVPEKA